MLYPPKKHFVSLLPIFVGVLFSNADGSGPCHSSPVEWLGFSSLTATIPPQSLAGTETLLHATAG